MTVQSQPNNPDPDNPYSYSSSPAHNRYQKSSSPQGAEHTVPASLQEQDQTSYPPSQHESIPHYRTAPQPATKRFSGSRRIVLIMLVVLIILLGVAALITLPVYTTRVMTDATATAQSGAATAQINITANAQTSATAVAGIYPFSSDLKLDDPLKDNSGGYEWGDQDGCMFREGTYRVSNNQKDTYYACFALKTSFRDFTYEVDAQLLKGKVLGILFRGNRADGKFYSFVVSSNGACAVEEYGGPEGTKRIKVTDPGTIKGFDAFKTNQISVVARNNTLAFYVNKQRVFTMSTDTFTEGQIGVIVYNIDGPVEASFSHAKVWVL